MISLPIPDKTSPVRYQDVTVKGYTLGGLVGDLTRGRVKPAFGAHLDPDLIPHAYSRQPGWRGLFGQAGGEQTVLERAGVGPGDLFLFFGWFRRVEQHDGGFRFVRGAPDLHVLWGWLQVDTVLTVGSCPIPTWAEYHPHVASSSQRKNNTLYIASESLLLEGNATGLPGAGVFARYAVNLSLTKPGARRSLWSLPGWFAPAPGRAPLGYHAELTRWSPAGDRVELRSAARGQEFVLDTACYPEALPWLRSLLIADGPARLV